MDDYIFLRQIAADLKVAYTTIRKRADKLGIPVIQVKTENNIASAAIAKSDFDKLMESLATIKVSGEDGFFYMIALIPEYNKGRIKLGFASDVIERLGNHKTAAPTAEIIKTWPCKRAYEATVIAAISSMGKQIRNEVYEFDNVDLVVAKADTLFSLLNVSNPISFDN